MDRIEALVSVIVICRNVSDILEECVSGICRLLQDRYTNYEVLIVDDFSTDDTLEIAERLLSTHHCVRLIGLSLHQGAEIATMAGLESAIGDFVVTMQPGHDAPEHILPLVDMVRSGHDIVIGVTDVTSYRNVFYRFFFKLYFALARQMIGVKLIPGNTTLCALSRRAVNAITSIRQRKRLFALVAAETGYPMATYPYQQQVRSRKLRHRSLWRSWKRGISILINNSNVPLRIVSGLGMMGSLLCLMYIFYVVVVNLVTDSVVEGWTMLSLLVSGLFFLVFLILAVIGQYMARVLDESMDRPLYIVRGEKASSIMISDAARRNVLQESLNRDDAAVADDSSTMKPTKNLPAS